MLQDAAHMNPDMVSAVHFIANMWRLITPTVIKSCLVKCGFSVESVRSNDDSAVKMKMTGKCN
jgi:hypothetical protein